MKRSFISFNDLEIVFFAGCKNCSTSEDSNEMSKFEFVGPRS